MRKSFKAQTSITLHAPVEKVWKTLTDPKAIKQFMFGADIKTDWKVGSPIVYTGEYQGKPFEEKGEIVQFEPNSVLQTTNFSSMSGQEDKPENYNLVTYRVKENGDRTKVTITQDNIRNEESLDGSTSNWKMVLKSLKRVVEKK
jgi:uncharacterized protein YndB with AHSA1/START domain